MRAELSLAVLFFLICTGYSLTIIEPSKYYGVIVHTPRSRTIGPRDWTFEIIRELVLPDAANLTDRIILLDLPVGQSQEQAAIIAVENITAGIITPLRADAPYPGLGAYIWDGSDSHLTMMPATEVIIADFNFLSDLIKNQTRVVVNMTSDEYNPWDVAFQQGGIAFSVVLSPLTLFAMGFAAFKLIYFIKYRGVQVSVVQIVLLFHIIGNAIRFVDSTVDPVMARTVFPLIVQQLLLTGSWPFSSCSTLLISFYWQELIDKTNARVSLFVKKLKIPFWIISCLIFSMELVSSTLRGTYYPLSVLTTLTGILYIVSETGLSILYFVSGIKIIKYIRASAKDKTSRRKANLMRTTRSIIISGVLMVFFVVVLAIGGLSNLLYVPWAYWSIWFTIYIFLTVGSIFQIAAFNLPKKGQSTTEGGSLSVRTVRSQNSLLTASGTGSRIEIPVPQTETAPAV
jgi:hypothetical protein